MRLSSRFWSPGLKRNLSKISPKIHLLVREKRPLQVSSKRKNQIISGCSLLLLLGIPVIPLVIESSSEFSPQQKAIDADAAASPPPEVETMSIEAETCQAQAMLAADAPPTRHLAQPAKWALRPEMSLASLARPINTVLISQLAAQPFPKISELALQAKVPVLMYHDILPEKEVFFDVTPAEFETHLKRISELKATPITLDQLVAHLQTGMPLPEKPVLLTFDDGYEGHYTYVLPLLRKYSYPAVFGIYPAKVGTKMGRSSLTWEQLREMAADPLVTIASHSFTHPPDLRPLPDDRLRHEIVASKRVLEEKLGITIHHFVYPVGKYNERVKDWVQKAGYRSALTMDDEQNKFAGESQDLLTIERMGQSQFEQAMQESFGGVPLPPFGSKFNFNAPLQVSRPTLEGVPLILISGGKPMTIHADSRYQVSEIIADTRAIAAVDGGFFSLEYLDSNTMIGPVYSQNTRSFVPGSRSDIPRLKHRPLVLISDEAVSFVPFDPKQHNSLQGIQAIKPGITDAFVAAAWLVKNGKPQPAAAFGTLFDFDAARHRAFWGISQTGQPVIGVSQEPVDSVTLGNILNQAGFREAVMLDSGASTSLAYRGELLVGYTPRPVPHVVALVPPLSPKSACTLASKQTEKD